MIRCLFVVGFVFVGMIVCGVCYKELVFGDVLVCVLCIVFDYYVYCCEFGMDCVGVGEIFCCMGGVVFF